MQVYTSFRGIPKSEALEAFTRDQAAGLERFFDRIMTCRVAVEQLQARRGQPWRVRIALRVPGEEIVVNRVPSLHATMVRAGDAEETKAQEVEARYKDAYFAISKAFRGAGRRLQDYVRRQQGDAKTHEAQPQGTVVRLDPQGQFGFLQAADGREIYFHRNSVLGKGFARLAIGSAVKYFEEPGEEGPQASTVRVVEKSRRS
jgi:cold shock CspA family protein